MCGIAGYVQRRGDHTPDAIGAMTDALRHRGPDGHGRWDSAFGEWQVTLGHRRLSIIDLAGGHQPLSNEDGTLWITFNGEIYNFRELRARLESQGHRFATLCDTESIVHHLEHRGPAGLAELNGMFAFALWNQTTGRLLLARDRAGIKPLYYAELPGGGFAFASELTALLKHSAVPREIDPDGVAAYFFADYIQPPRTILRGVRKLEPGHYLEWDASGVITVTPFWSLQPGGADPDMVRRMRPLREMADELWSKTEAAVDAQLMADVPVGVFLSGGIDSSIVAAAAAAARKKAGQVRTFSIAFADPQFDESVHARAVARYLGTSHVEETFDETALLQTLDAALDSLDEPMADPSILPTYLLSRVAAKHVKVALGGDGGDELWAGYPTYKAHAMARAYSLVPRFIRRAVVEPLVAAMPVSDGYQSLEWKAKRFALRWDADPMRRHVRWMSNADIADVERFVRGHRSLLQGYDGLLTPRSNDRLNAILALDFMTYLPGSVLTKVDRASMAHSLEVRPPLLDNTLIDYAFALWSAFKLRGRVSKFLLKRAAAGHLPEEIINRRKKGFGIPLSRWLKGPLAERVDRILQPGPMWEACGVDRDVFVSWRDEHAAARVDRSKPLWALIVLDHWFHRALVPSPSGRRLG
jgi:asparagine synthase (glutamine-hydrolysing)